MFATPSADDEQRSVHWLPAGATAITLSLLLLLLNKYSPWLDKPKALLHDHAYAPLQRMVYAPLSGLSRQWQQWQQEEDLAAQVQQLRAQNGELRTQIQLLGHYQAENRRLRMLMDSVGSVTVPVMIAEIFDSNIEGYRETILINKGLSDGVYQHQAVIDPFGLVGQVTEVFEHQARVMLISDGRSRVPVYVERTQQRALLSGMAERSALTVENIRLDSDIQIGDRLVSSGLGGVFPRGYPVAEVVDVSRDQRNSFLQIELKSLAHLSSMLEVLLLDQRDIIPEVILPVGPPRPAQLGGQ